MANGVSKAMATINRVTKASTKVFANALPILSVAGNLIQAQRAFPTEPGLMLNRIIRNYTGQDFVSGRWSGDAFMSGTGTLIISAVASRVIKALS